jgi:hypothetical protein
VVTARRFVLASALCVASCTRSQSPSAPGPSVPAPPVLYNISGTIRDDLGHAVEGASVSIGFLGAKTGPLLSATTAADGSFRGRIGPSSSYELSVLKPGYLRLLQYPFAVSGDASVDLTLQRGVMISGVVSEAGVDPRVAAVTGATVEIVSGQSAGQSTTTGPPGVEGSYVLTTLPGTVTVRATKSGYDAVENTVTALADTRVNLEMHWAYGSCLQSVTPVLFDGYGAKGGIESFNVTATAGRSWTATPDSPWIELVSRAIQVGSNQVTFRIAPNPAGATERRKGAVMIRCSASEGQNVWIFQVPDCQVRLTPTTVPDPFPSEGGTGFVAIHTGVAACHWEASTDADWLHVVGVQNWSGDFPNAAFLVTPNTSGAPRAAHFIVNEVPMDVRQQ